MTTSQNKSCAPLLPKDKRYCLHGEWQFSQSGTDEWLSATVPGCNFTDLIANHKIEDPFYRDNEAALQWIEQKDWHYRKRFTLSDEAFSQGELLLVTEGLDTFCDIYINEQKLASSRNMFVGHRFACKSFLRVGENSIEIRFRSPINETMPLYNAAGYAYPAENDKSHEKLSVYCRKAPCHFGWDWGPRFVTSGIWRDIYLQVEDRVKVEDVYFSLSYLSDAQASFAFDLNIKAQQAFTGQLRIKCEQAPKLNCVQNIIIAHNAHKCIKIEMMLESPQKWWPNGLGDAFLYQFEFELINDGTVLSRHIQKVGMRTIELINQTDKDGVSFYFKVNGVNVFMKGANYIPGDSFITRVTPEKHRKLFEASCDANMNMLRVWGGGIYQDDYFYDLADEHGILIWQDFMFACSLYPASADFIENVKEEAKYNILRLRNHPCIALWCGNNEVDMAIEHWQWPEKFGYSNILYDKLKDDYTRLFDVYLRDSVSQFDGNRFYLRSSPIGAWESKEDHIGNHHYWGVWHGEEPFSEYQKRIPRFMSEYGFQSFPTMASVQKFTQTGDHSLQSNVMLTHQKHPRGNSLIDKYMSQEYQAPKDFEHLLYLSQVQQALGLKLAFEAHRKAMPFCMGTLYWQMNDTWPAASWSGIDYYGKWKALHYQAKRSFEQQLLVIQHNDQDLNIQLVSDSLHVLHAQLDLQVINFSGEITWTYQSAVTIAANTSAKVFSIAKNEILTKLDLSSIVLIARLTNSKTGHLLTQNAHYFLANYQLALLPSILDVSYKVVGNVIEFSLQTDQLMRQVYLEINNVETNFSDNFIDLFPGQTTKVCLALNDNELDNAAELIHQLTWTSLYHSYSEHPKGRLGHADLQELRT